MRNNSLPEKLFPVLMKPIDSGGGVGARICYNNLQVKKAIKEILNISKQKKYLCQKFFLNDDIQLYYTIVNKQPYLSSIVDRKTNKKQNNKSPVCIGALYNSVYKNLILKRYNQKFIKLLKSLKIKNGVFSVQCFIKNQDLYPYDPGFRLQGEGQHLVLRKINNFDHLEMLINLSLGLNFFEGNFKKFNDLSLKKNYVCSVWILLKRGKK